MEFDPNIIVLFLGGLSTLIGAIATYRGTSLNAKNEAAKIRGALDLGDVEATERLQNISVLMVQTLQEQLEKARKQAERYETLWGEERAKNTVLHDELRGIRQRAGNGVILCGQIEGACNCDAQTNEIRESICDIFKSIQEGNGA